MACWFIPCRRCLPEQDGRSAATRSIGIQGPSITGQAWPASQVAIRAGLGFGARAASSATVPVRYLQAVAVLMSNPAANSPSRMLVRMSRAGTGIARRWW
jgi:hypothetical protein